MNCKHKFRARYSEKYPEWFEKLVGKAYDGSGDKNTYIKNINFSYPSVEKIYEGDVCIRCGMRSWRKSTHE